MGKPIKPLDRADRNAYSRGYQQAIANRWPLHKTPYPSEPIIGELVAALRALRDAIDGELAKFEENDPLNAALSPFIERADKAQTAVALWLMDDKIP